MKYIGSAATCSLLTGGVLPPGGSRNSPASSASSAISAGLIPGI